MADEIGERGTYHIHLYVCFGSRVRISTIKRQFREAHIEIAHGTVKSNIDYIKKNGKWADSDKAETSVKGTYEEWGETPTQKGLHPDMQELYQLISDGYSNSDILAINNDYILHIDKLDKVRTMLLTEKYKSTRRLDMQVVYVYGATGTGKTRDILNFHADENVYRVTDYQHPFDSYACQPVIAFEEYRSQIKISDLLNYIDIYPMELPARYANKYACYNFVYLTSNWPLEKQYKEIQESSPETWKAFLRRIKQVKVYHEDGTIDTYDSAQAYLDRGEKVGDSNTFEQLKIPFDNGDI